MKLFYSGLRGWLSRGGNPRRALFAVLVGVVLPLLLTAGVFAVLWAVSDASGERRELMRSVSNDGRWTAIAYAHATGGATIQMMYEVRITPAPSTPEPTSGWMRERRGSRVWRSYGVDPIVLQWKGDTVVVVLAWARGRVSDGRWKGIVSATRENKSRWVQPD